jgi:hypothetical protein
MGADQSVAGGALPGQMTFLTKHAQLETTYCIWIQALALRLMDKFLYHFIFFKVFLFLKKQKMAFFLFFFYVLYSTLLYLPPLRFHCVGGLLVAHYVNRKDF